MFNLGGLKVTFPETITELDIKFTCVSPVVVPAGCSDFRSRARKLPDVSVCFAEHSGSRQPLVIACGKEEGKSAKGYGLGEGICCPDSSCPWQISDLFSLEPGFFLP